MKRKMRKFLLTLSAALLLVSLSVGVTVAYLTDSDAVTNTFTVGQVHIKLDEAETNLAGEPLKGEKVVELVNADRGAGNEYKLIPGHTYTKDPTVTLEADSEDAYIRMLVTINKINELKAACGVDASADFLPQNFVNGWDAAKWPCVKMTPDAAKNTCTYEFHYSQIVNTVDTDELKLDPLFTSFTMPGGATNDQLKELEDLEIGVVAHAIQADGFKDNKDGAWTAFDQQKAANP